MKKKITKKKSIALVGGGMADKAAARQAVQQPPMREPGFGSMNPRKPTMRPMINPRPQRDPQMMMNSRPQMMKKGGMSRKGK